MTCKYSSITIPAELLDELKLLKEKGMLNNLSISKFVTKAILRDIQETDRTETIHNYRKYAKQNLGINKCAKFVLNSLCVKNYFGWVDNYRELNSMLYDLANDLIIGGHRYNFNLAELGAFLIECSDFHRNCERHKNNRNYYYGLEAEYLWK